MVRVSTEWTRLEQDLSLIVRLPNPGFLDNLAIRSVQGFLLFLYLRDVLFKNLDDATLSPLGNPHNMQIKAAITENSVFVNISVTAHGIEIILVSIHMFLGVKNRTKQFL